MVKVADAVLSFLYQCMSVDPLTKKDERRCSVMMKVYAESTGGNGRRATGATSGGGTTTTLRQRYQANRAAGRGRVSSAVNALRGRTPG